MKEVITVPFRGTECTLSELSKLTGISNSTLHKRYSKGRRGKALVSKVAPINKPRVLLNGHWISLETLSKRHKIPLDKLRKRYYRGVRDHNILYRGNMQDLMVPEKGTKLTAKQACEIWILLKMTSLSQPDIAKRYNISPCSVSDINTRRRWSKVTSKVNLFDEQHKHLYLRNTQH